MKVSIESNSGPFVLSRRAVIATTSVLPAHVVARATRLDLVGPPDAAEPFKFFPKQRIVHFCCRGNPRDANSRNRALRELLTGLARLDPNLHQEDVEAFVDEWVPRCLQAITAAGN